MKINPSANTVPPKYPATCLVTWAASVVPCCDEHAAALKKLADHMGWGCIFLKLEVDCECTNCINEANKQLSARL